MTSRASESAAEGGWLGEGVPGSGGPRQAAGGGRRAGVRGRHRPGWGWRQGLGRAPAGPGGDACSHRCFPGDLLLHFLHPVRRPLACVLM